MRVFVTGATGFIGSALVQELLGAGHRVVGLARSDASAAALTQVGAEVHRGSLDDAESLQSGAAGADGVIHCAYDHDFIDDFSKYAESGRTDLRAVEAMGAALVGSDRPFVVTSGTALVLRDRPVTEEDAPDLGAVAAVRGPSEVATLALAGRGVRSSLVRLAPSVHGEGDRGFVPMFIAAAREKGVSAYVGDGGNRWPAVHRLDAARLFRLALERGEAGSRFHGAHDEGVPFREIAAAIGRHLGVPVVSKTPEEAEAHFGGMAGFATIDNPTSSALTQARLGWAPERPGLLADLDAGHYFAAPTS